MKGPVKAIVLAVAVIVLVGGAFFGGLAYEKATSSSTASGMPGANGAMAQGGPMANLTEEQQAEIENMTEEERQQWFQENRGTPPDGAQGGPARGGNLEGEVLEVADDSITISLDSGSQTIYLDEDTVIAYVKGAADLAVGSQVMVISTPVGGPSSSSSSSSSSNSTSSDIVTASLVVVTE